MKAIRRTSQFKQDYKRMVRRGKRFDEFKSVIEQIALGGQLAAKYRDHELVGQYTGTRECHIEPDWLLIYELSDDDIVLVRTGTHADLFE